MSGFNSKSIWLSNSELNKLKLAKKKKKKKTEIVILNPNKAGFFESSFF